MARHHLSSQEITSALMRGIREGALPKKNDPDIDEWICRSKYNRSVFEEIHNDENLRQRLVASSGDDDFWSIIIAYRIAMHDEIPSANNFWQRISKRIGKSFNGRT